MAVKSTRETALMELAEKQQHALELANNIIQNQRKLIDLCEKETAIYKRENNKLGRAVMILSALLTISLISFVCLI